MGRSGAARCSKRGWRSVIACLAILAATGCKCARSAADDRQEDLARLPQGPGSLQDQLAAEDGITFNAPKQGYGRKLLASSCASADSLDGMIATVCEYPTREQARVLGAQLAGSQSRVRKQSVLQVVARSDTPPEHVAKVLSTFDAL